MLYTKLFHAYPGRLWCRSHAVDALIVLCTFKGTMYLFHPADSAWYELPSVCGNLYSQSGADEEGLNALLCSISLVCEDKSWIWLINLHGNKVYSAVEIYLFLLLLIGYNLEMCISAVCSVFLGILLYTPCQCSACPFGCECFAVTRTVKCVSKDLLMVPQIIPGYAKTVIVTGNNIHQIGPDSFTELENVTNIILSNNRWECHCLFFVSFMYIKPYLNNMTTFSDVHLINK